MPQEREWDDASGRPEDDSGADDSGSDDDYDDDSASDGGSAASADYDDEEILEVPEPAAAVPVAVASTQTQTRSSAVAKSKKRAVPPLGTMPTAAAAPPQDRRSAASSAVSPSPRRARARDVPGGSPGSGSGSGSGSPSRSHRSTTGGGAGGGAGAGMAPGGGPDSPSASLGTAVVADHTVKRLTSTGGGNEKKAARQVVLVPSLFQGRKPTILFDYPTYIPCKRVTATVPKVQPPGRTLYFRFSESVHEYNCCRNAYLRAGLKRTEGVNWNMLWSKHLTEEEFLSLTPYQKVNHFPGSWGMGRKDRLARNLGRMRRDYGKAFEISARTYHLPADRNKLRTEMQQSPKSIFIVKPPASSCGRGIRLISGAANSKVPKKKIIVQSYIRNPYLINGKKFDLRVYVLVTSFDPLRAYLFNNGLVRFCTEKYTLSHKNLKNRFAHLTNYSVNKKSEKFEKNTDASDDQYGSKWSLQALLRYFEKEGVDSSKPMAAIKDVIIKTLISCEGDIASHVNRYFADRHTYGTGSPCFEVFGFDVLLDENLKAWILEVNVSPSLSSSSPLDKEIKNTLMTDAFNAVGVIPYDNRRWDKEKEQRKSGRLLGLGKGSFKASSRHRNVNEVRGLKLDQLHPDELNVICECEEEYARRGNFERIFPTTETHSYFKYFPAQRANNLILHLWLTKWRGSGQPFPVPLAAEAGTSPDLVELFGTPRRTVEATPRRGRRAGGAPSSARRRPPAGDSSGDSSARRSRSHRRSIDNGSADKLGSTSGSADRAGRRRARAATPPAPAPAARREHAMTGVSGAGYYDMNDPAVAAGGSSSSRRRRTGSDERSRRHRDDSGDSRTASRSSGSSSARASPRFGIRNRADSSRGTTPRSATYSARQMAPSPVVTSQPPPQPRYSMPATTNGAPPRLYSSFKSDGGGGGSSAGSSRSVRSVRYQSQSGSSRSVSGAPPPAYQTDQPRRSVKSKAGKVARSSHAGSRAPRVSGSNSYSAPLSLGISALANSRSAAGAAAAGGGGAPQGSKYNSPYQQYRQRSGSWRG